MAGKRHEHQDAQDSADPNADPYTRAGAREPFEVNPDVPDDYEPPATRQQREQVALNLRSRGYNFDYIAKRCGYVTRSAARKAWERAAAEVTRDTVEQARANFKQAYDAIRVTLQRRARAGEPRAVEALVKLDEREARLLGYDAPILTGPATVPIIIEVPAGLLDAIHGRPRPLTLDAAPATELEDADVADYE